MTLASFVLIMSGVLLNATAQLMLKAGTRVLGTLDMSSAGALVHAVVAMSMQPYILVGVACYVLSLGIWIAALSAVDVSIAYPMLSIGYVVVAVAAWWLFGEALTPMRIIGIAIILVGVYILSRQ